MIGGINMKLYKNVDICDLESIMQKGILSIDDYGKNNWKDGKRSDNDTSVVYLFNPTDIQNSFPDYGTALLEVDVDAEENKIEDNDAHFGDYKEYVVKKVYPCQIKRIIIPLAFKNYVDIPNRLKITWCGIKAQFYKEDELEYADENIIDEFAKTAALMDSKWFNFFRGKNGNGEIFDLYNIQYIF